MNPSHVAEQAQGDDRPHKKEPYVHPVLDEGLGTSSYLVEVGDGRALVVDPSRDPARPPCRRDGGPARRRVRDDTVNAP